jgi:CDGSH-type Zn-finger protein
MTTPDIAQKGPYMLDLQPGSYWWCACGKSKNQPFCDGAHQGTDIGPLKFEVSAPRRAALCGGKRAGAKPYCDGSHKGL